LGFVGDENELHEVADQLGTRGGNDFRMYGGHRLWVAPETDRTTFPDNVQVAVGELPNGARFVASDEDSALQKTLEVRLDPDRARVVLVHEIANRGEQTTSAAPWALTVLRPGGVAVLPLPPRAPWGPKHLLPTACLALWSYTDLTLSCWRAGTKYIQLEQTRVAEQGFGMQKLGLRNDAGWGAYYRSGHLFVKRAGRPAGDYVDLGSNFEVFAESKFIELETLGPDTRLVPGAAVQHTEEWMLFRDVAGGIGDDWADREILPRVERH
jgi:hypothetical protein